MALGIAARRDERKRGNKLFSYFMWGIVLLVVIGFFFEAVVSFNPTGQGDTFRYAGLAFKQTRGGFYAADLDGRLLEFVYRPEAVSDIEVSPAIIDTVTESRVVYITYDWNNTLAQDMALLQYDAGNILEAEYGIFVQPAFTGANPLNISAVSCENATGFVPVVLIQQANSTAISSDSSNPGCVVLNASGSVSLARVSDRFKYALLKGNEK